MGKKIKKTIMSFVIISVVLWIICFPARSAQRRV